MPDHPKDEPSKPRYMGIDPKTPTVENCVWLSPSEGAPSEVVEMVARLSTRLSEMSLKAVATGKLRLEAGDHVATQVELARADAYREAATLALTIARNL